MLPMLPMLPRCSRLFRLSRLWRLALLLASPSPPAPAGVHGPRLPALPPARSEADSCWRDGNEPAFPAVVPHIVLWAYVDGTSRSSTASTAAQLAVTYPFRVPDPPTLDWQVAMQTILPSRNFRCVSNATFMSGDFICSSAQDSTQGQVCETVISTRSKSCSPPSPGADNHPGPVLTRSNGTLIEVSKGLDGLPPPLRNAAGASKKLALPDGAPTAPLWASALWLRLPSEENGGGCLMPPQPLLA